MFVAGIVTGQLLADNYYQKSHIEKYDAKTRKAYIDRANASLMVRNISIAGAAAIYVWNVIDGVVAKGNKHIVVGNAALAMTPYVNPYSAGLAFNITF